MKRPPPPPDPLPGGKPDEPEVYDLGSGEESDEEQRERALRELVEAESRTAPDEDIPTIDISTDEPSDEIEREQALLDVLKLGAARPADAEEDVPVVEISTTDEIDETERERALQELLRLEEQLAKQAEADADEVPVVEITVEGDVDEAARLAALREVVNLGPEKSRRSTARQDIPRAADLPQGAASDQVVRAQAILDVVQHAARFTKAIALARPMESYRARPIVLTLLAVTSLSLMVYSLVGRPEWVYGPDPAKTPVAEREANLRFVTYLVVQRVNAYRDARRGFLPGSLEEVGESWPGLSYTLVGQTEYEVRAIEPGAPPVIYRSTQDAEATLLEPSRPFLRARQ
jgi:hypothetical protein